MHIVVSRLCFSCRDSNKQRMGLKVTDNTVCELDASLDISVVEKLLETLNQITQSDNSIQIDANKIERIDSAAFQLLYSYQKSMDKKQTVVSFVNPSAVFLENATLLGLHKILNIKH